MPTVGGGMMLGRVEVGYHVGCRYKLKHARLCDEMLVESKARVWFLWIDDDFIGNFPTKGKAFKYMKAFERGIV